MILEILIPLNNNRKNMTSNYALVLTPSSQNIRTYLTVSHRLSKGHCVSDFRRTSPYRPHITLVRFKCDSARKFMQIWFKFAEIQPQLMNQYTPKFKEIIFTSLDIIGETQIKLLVEKNPIIMSIRDTAIRVLREFDIEPLQKKRELYQPFLLIAYVKSLNEQEKEEIRNNFPKNILSNESSFILEGGQLNQSNTYGYRLAPLSV